MVEFVIGRSGSGKSYYLQQNTERIVSAGTSVCWIVPEQESMMTERLWGQNSGVEVLSFHRLCDTLMRHYGGGAKPRIGDVASLGILFRAVQGVKPRLTYYRKSAGSVRFYEKLLPVLEDFAAYKAEGERILPLLANTESYEKYQDLFLIYDSYRALKAQDYRDQFDDLDTAANLLSEYNYFEGKTVCIDHFAGFTEQEYKILEYIFLQAENVYLTLTADESDPMLFSPTLRHLKRLSKLCESYGLACKKVRCNFEGCSEKDGLRVLERHLFSVDKPKSKVSDDGSVRIFVAAGIEEEVRLVASDIRRRVLSGECAYRDISVVSNVQDEYSHTVQMIFDEMDIPLFCDRKIDVLSRPLFSMILHAFDAVEYNYRYEDMFSFAKSHLCGLDYESIAKLENYVYIWNIRGQKWEMQWTQSPFGLDGGDDKQAEKLLSDINCYRRHIIEPLIEFREDTATGKATDLLAAVWRLTENFGVAKSLQEYATAEKDRDAAEQWLKLYDLFIELLDQLALVLGDSRITRKELHDIMEVVLRGYRFGVAPAYMDQVHFGDMVRARSSKPEHLYVLGAAHGKFPATVSGSPMITDRDIRHFEEHSILLSKDSATVALEQQFCLYRTLADAAKSITFTYSAFSSDGAAELPSHLISRITDKLIDITVQQDPHLIDHRLGFLQLVASLPQDHPQYSAFADFIKKNFDMDIASWRTEKVDDTHLPRQIVAALYGKELSASQSRLESFVGCPFKFFLQYGLKIKETQPVTFAANYIGDFVHFGMEHLMKEIKAHPDLSQWDNDRVDDVLDRVSDEYFRMNLSDMTSPRFDHLYDRICRTMHLVGYSALDELKNSDFFPALQEYRFERSIPLSDGFYAKLNGFIDRVDTAEIGGEKWMKIVDYKTGDKSLDLANIYNGYQLQLPLYTRALSSHPDFKGYNTAAMEYFLAGVPKFGENEDFQPETLATAFRRRGLYVAETEIAKALDHSGGMYTNAPLTKNGTFSARAAVADRKQLEDLGDFVEKKLISVMEQMAGGEVSVCPMKQGINACQYCNYNHICRFEYGKNKVRTYEDIGNADFFAAIGKEES